MARLWTMLAVMLGLLGLAAPASAAGKRIALVIGNSRYAHTAALANPRNDATDIADALRKVGFEVLDGFDLDKAAFERRLRDFSVALRGADVGLFFYAGHGLQVAGQNYLVPVDAKVETADALDWELVRLDLVHRTMERATQTNVIFLDACRNNPLARNLARSLGTRSSDIGRGLAPVESGVGTLISFSTQPGNVALDGKGRNSPFAAALAKQMRTSTEDLSALLIDVRNDVIAVTQNAQIPWEHSALTGRFYFTRPSVAAASPSATPSPSQYSEAAQTWNVIKDTEDIPTLEAFRRQYGSANPLFDRLAETRVLDLTKRSAAASASRPATSPVPNRVSALDDRESPLLPLPSSPSPSTAAKEKAPPPRRAKPSRSSLARAFPALSFAVSQSSSNRADPTPASTSAPGFARPRATARPSMPASTCRAATSIETSAMSPVSTATSPASRSRHGRQPSRPTASRLTATT